MGQYFIAVNTTKREFIHPHNFGDGQKFLEFSEGGSFLGGLALLLRQSTQGGGGDWLGYTSPVKALEEYPCVGSWAGDAICIVGDYDKSQLYHDAENPDLDYNDVSFHIMRAMAADHYTRTKLQGSLDWRMNPAYTGLGCDDKELAKYKRIFEEPTFQERATGLPEPEQMASRLFNREEKDEK